MAVNLSPVGGVAAQFFSNNGVPLSGGKLYTYSAGTTTPAATYTNTSGTTAWTNPIVLDAGGRVSGSGEIWLTDGVSYKFVLKDSNDVLIATYDNITGINSNFVNFTAEQEIQTATAGQTVFNLADIQYQPGTNSLTVYVDGVNQYGPGAQYAYLETDSDTVTFVSGLHVGASVKFTTATQTTGNATDASVVSFTGFNGQTGNVQNLADDDGSDWIGFIQEGTGAVAVSAQDKMRQIVNVMDFGAVGDGVADDTTAIGNAIAACLANNLTLTGEGTFKLTAPVDFRKICVAMPNATFDIAHAGLGIYIGGNSANPNNPPQHIGSVTRSVGTDAYATPSIRVIGSSCQHVTVEFVDYIQLYADTSTDQSGQAYAVQYSTFTIKNCVTLELTNNASTTGNPNQQYINENIFYLNAVQNLLINGTYQHNHNTFNDGNFELGNINMVVGGSNYVNNIRGEQGLTVTFGSGVTDCIVTIGWVSSAHRYPTSNVVVTNNGNMCAVQHLYDLYAPITPIVGFGYQNLKKVGADYNVIGAKNTTVGASNLTVAGFDYFYESVFLPVNGENTVFEIDLYNVTTGGIRVDVDGYDASKVAITPAPNQMVFDGTGNVEFGQASSTSNTQTSVRFFILDSNCKYIVVNIRAGGVGAVFDSLYFGARVPDIALRKSLAAYSFTNNNFV